VYDKHIHTYMKIKQEKMSMSNTVRFWYISARCHIRAWDRHARSWKEKSDCALMTAS